MKLEVRSTTKAPVEEIASRARRIPDRVRRLRYLRKRLVLAPTGARWQTAAMGFTALIGIAILVWILT